MLTSVFDFAIYISAVAPVVERTNSKVLPDAHQDLGTGRQGRFQQHQARFSAARGSSFPSLAKSFERAGALPGKCLMLLKDSFAA